MSGDDGRELLFFLGFGGGVQDSVEEGCGLRTREFLGQLEGFIDDDLDRRSASAQFVDGEAQDGAVNFRQALDAPVLG